MSHLQQQQLKEDIAWQLFGDVTLTQAKWRDSVIQHSSSISLRERRVRLALASNDMHSLAQWLKRLPKESRNKEEWQYWQAITLIAQGKHSQGKRYYSIWSSDADFIPWLRHKIKHSVSY